MPYEIKQLLHLAAKVEKNTWKSRDRHCHIGIGRSIENAALHSGR